MTSTGREDVFKTEGRENELLQLRKNRSKTGIEQAYNLQQNVVVFLVKLWKYPN